MTEVFLRRRNVRRKTATKKRAPAPPPVVVKYVYMQLICVDCGQVNTEHSIKCPNCFSMRQQWKSR